MTTRNRILGTLAAVAAMGALSLPLGANAQTEQTLDGTITAFDGRYDVHVRDAQGNVDDVQLHQGTIINPRGLTLYPGMHVRILGFTQNDVFEANEIDTGYQLDYAPDGSMYPAYTAPYNQYWSSGSWGYAPWALGFGLGYGLGYPYWGYGYSPIIIVQPNTPGRPPVHLHQPLPTHPAPVQPIVRGPAPPPPPSHH